MSASNSDADGWGGPLDGKLRRIGKVATGSGEIRILRGGSRMAFGLPRDLSAAGVVIGLYQPNRAKGRIFQLLATMLVKTGAYRRVLPPSKALGDGPVVGWLQEASAVGQVGFLGCNPAHGLRCVLGGIIKGEPFVAKLGFGRSRDAIVREAEVLDELKAGGRPGVLPVVSLETGDDWALLRLPHLAGRMPQGMSDPQVVGLLDSWLEEAPKRLAEIPWGADLLGRARTVGADEEWCGRMSRREVRPALLHGDFAVWNLRLMPEGPRAIDWEWAVDGAVGGVDLAYGLRQEAVLVRRLDPSTAVAHILEQARKAPFKPYLHACGWEGALADWLKLGLLHAQFNAGTDCAGMLEALDGAGKDL